MNYSNIISQLISIINFQLAYTIHSISKKKKRKKYTNSKNRTKIRRNPFLHLLFYNITLKHPVTHSRFHIDSSTSINVNHSSSVIVEKLFSRALQTAFILKTTPPLPPLRRIRESRAFCFMKDFSRNRASFPNK